jgi:hypothetical protein
MSPTLPKHIMFVCENMVVLAKNRNLGKNDNFKEGRAG